MELPRFDRFDGLRARRRRICGSARVKFISQRVFCEEKVARSQGRLVFSVREG